jgi:hypothetical protein
MSFRHALFCIGLFLASLLAGCKSGAPEGQWVSARVSAGHERLLLEVTELALRKSGFPVGAGLDPARLTATSGWKNSLAPFKGKGYREQATVKFTRQPEKQRYQVDVRVARETNEDIARPMDLSYAQWESAADNVELARIVLRFIQGLLSTGEEVLQKPGRAQ